MIAKVMQVLLALTLIALLTVACSHQLIADTAQEFTEASGDPFATRLSDEAIRVAIIRHARAAYYGSCPCPDSIDQGAGVAAGVALTVGQAVNYLSVSRGTFPTNWSAPSGPRTQDKRR